LSSYESLVTRGYTIDGVLGLEDEYYRNHDFFREYFAERGIDFWSFEKPHDKAGLSLEEDVDKLDRWYNRIEDGRIEQSDNMVEVVTKLEQKHRARVDELKSMPARTHKSIWWPFTQHGIVSASSYTDPVSNLTSITIAPADQQGLRCHGH
jgi:dethiobiotin synthetase/adenosylmethionine--8-amino-7-oxononanoate aminotransferase